MRLIKEKVEGCTHGMDTEVPSTLHRLTTGITVEYYLSVVKLPCERRAASLIVGMASRYIRESAIALTVFSALFIVAVAASIVAFLLVNATLFKMVLAIFVFLASLMAVLAASRAVKLYRISSKLLDMSSAIESGVIEENVYCDKTLYQAYTELYGYA